MLDGRSVNNAFVLSEVAVHVAAFSKRSSRIVDAESNASPLTVKVTVVVNGAATTGVMDVMEAA